MRAEGRGATTDGKWDPWALVRACNELVGSAASADELWARAVTLLGQVFDAPSVIGAALVPPDRLVPAALHGWPGDDGAELWPDGVRGEAALILAAPTAVVTGDLAAEDRFVPSPVWLRLGYRSTLSCRIADSSGPLGLFTIASRSVDAFDDADAASFETMVAVLGAGLAGHVRRSELVRLGATDPVTRLPNREHGMAAIEARLRQGRPTTVLVVDLEGFHEINDRHGFALGDRILRVVAERISGELAGDDLVMRSCSDSFVIATSQTAPAAVRLLTEHLLTQLETVISLGDTTVDLAASIGAVTAEPGAYGGELVLRAEQAMRQAKSAGRSRYVHLWHDEPVEATDEVVPFAAARPRASETEVDRAIEGARVVFQPIVRIGSGALAGIEALARGPRGSALERPDLFFEAAATTGRLQRLELAVKRLAFAAPLPPDVRLFVNLEPSAFTDEAWIAELTEAWVAAGERPNIVAELTERALIESPGRLLRTVERCRALGWAIALDDVGARAESLAALRFLQPDVIKLDMRLVRGNDQALTTQIACAVAGYRDRHPAEVVAEGVETDEQVELAEMLGATLVQGFLVGRPTELEDLRITGEIDGFSSATAMHLGEATVRIGTKRSLVHLSRHIESVATASDCVLVAALQHSEHFTPATRQRYANLARRCGFVGVLGEDLPAGTTNGIRTAPFPANDFLAASWYVVLLSTGQSLALLAEEIDTMVPVPDGDRLFRYRLVTRPDEVETVAQRLLEYF